MKSYEQYDEEIMKERGVSRKSAVQYMRRNPEKFPTQGKEETLDVVVESAAATETLQDGDEHSNTVPPAAETVCAEGVWIGGKFVETNDAETTPVVEIQTHVGLLTETFNETLENAGLLSTLPSNAAETFTPEQLSSVAEHGVLVQSAPEQTTVIEPEDAGLAISAAAETAIQAENLGITMHVPAPLPANVIVNGSMQETAPFAPPKAPRKRRATAEPKLEGEQQPKGKPGRKGKVDAFDVETVKKLYAEGRKVVDIAVAVGYERGTGQNRVRNVLIEAGVYKQAEKAAE